jgi:hypothetical protein
MYLRKENVPDEIVPLIPYAEKWGIGDDYERERKISNATDAELVDLVRCFAAIDRNAFFAWLEGPESYDVKPTDEYVAFTCLTMAVESAKIEAKDRGIGE